MAVRLAPARLPCHLRSLRLGEQRSVLCTAQKQHPTQTKKTVSRQATGPKSGVGGFRPLSPEGRLHSRVQITSQTKRQGMVGGGSDLRCRGWTSPVGWKARTHTNQGVERVMGVRLRCRDPQSPMPPTPCRSSTPSTSMMSYWEIINAYV